MSKLQCADSFVNFFRAYFSKNDYKLHISIKLHDIITFLINDKFHFY